jgi:hypothetical protein
MFLQLCRRNVLFLTYSANSFSVDEVSGLRSVVDPSVRAILRVLRRLQIDDSLALQVLVSSRSGLPKSDLHILRFVQELLIEMPSAFRPLVALPRRDLLVNAFFELGLVPAVVHLLFRVFWLKDRTETVVQGDKAVVKVRQDILQFQVGIHLFVR